MIKKLVRHGNSLALIIDKPILELLKIDEDTPLELSTNGRGLLLVPADEKRRRKFEEGLADINTRYARALKRLAE